MTKRECKIIYILGAGHSGSTLLDLLLGSNKNIFTLGEFGFYPIYTERLKHSKVNLLTKYNCTCGKDVSDCDYWKNVKRLSKGGTLVKDKGIKDSLKIVFNLFNPLDLEFDIKTGDNKKLFEAAYRAARKRKKNVSFILDSSKDPRRLYELASDNNIDSSSIYVIYMVRDGRAYINSHKKDIRLKIGQPKRNMFDSLLEWVAINWTAKKVIKRLNLRTLEITYKEFANNTGKVLERIESFLDCELETKNYLDKVNNSTYHNLSGNMIRLKKIKAIKHDESWK